MKIHITLDVEPAELPLANEIIATLRCKSAHDERPHLHHAAWHWALLTQANACHELLASTHSASSQTTLHYHMNLLEQ